MPRPHDDPEIITTDDYTENNYNEYIEDDFNDCHEDDDHE
jgi:hypothetical protein